MLQLFKKTVFSQKNQMLSKLIFHRLLGWKISGQLDADIKKAVVIVYPHTSWHDFYIGALARKIINREINYVAKQELFNSPFGWYFKWMGGAPIDRKTSKNTVDQIVKIFKERSKFRLAITPEGTRKKVKHWKTGFYHIAKAAEVPIIPIAFDYATKTVKFYPAFEPLENLEATFNHLRKCFTYVEGKHAELKSPLT
jgi:1-acyl-sn-glycerol-3-phosphate acyltransferase